MNGIHFLQGNPAMKGIQFLPGNPAYVTKGIHFLRENPKVIHQRGLIFNVLEVW